MSLIGSPALALLVFPMSQIPFTLVTSFFLFLQESILFLTLANHHLFSISLFHDLLLYNASDAGLLFLTHAHATIIQSIAGDVPSLCASKHVLSEARIF